jgi:pimeloyl-ACP methyl ester carboxylesterase
MDTRLVLTSAGAATIGLAAVAHRQRTRPPLARLEHSATHRGGTGTPLLLVHGVSATWRVWSPVLKYLEPHHDVIASTLIGHAGGAVLGPDVEPSMAAVVDGIERDLDQMGVDTVHVAGNSLGGWAAIELARRGRARSLVLFSPAGASRTQSDLERLAETMIKGFAALTWCARHADAIASNAVLRRLIVYTQVRHPQRVSAEYVAASLRAFAEAPGISTLLEAISHEQVAPLPSTGAYPVRLVWPCQDRVLPFAKFGLPMAERLDGAELIRIPDVGHVPMSDSPAVVAEMILGVTRLVDAAAVSRQQEQG